MKIYINYDNKSRANFSIYYYISSIFKKIELGLFIFASVFLIITSKVNKTVNTDISMFFVDISLPIVDLSSAPFSSASNAFSGIKDLVNAKRENKALRQENEKLKSLYITSLNINQENKELKDALKFISLKSTNYKAARLIGRSHQMYSSNVFIDIGSKSNIKEDNVVIGKYSVIGRVVEVADDKSRVMLITDVNSKIPVITSKSRTRGILMGNNGNSMEIIYLDKKHRIKPGDMVFTSGDGDVLPPGLLVGIVKKISKTSVSVTPAENINNLGIVTVIDY